MKMLKQEIYFPIIISIHFIFWAVDLYFYKGSFMEVSSDTLLFGELTNESWKNTHRILGEVFSSWVVTVFAFNFLMATRAKWVEKLFGGLDKMYLIHRRSGVIAVVLLLLHFIVVPRDLVEFNPGKPLGFYAFILIILGVILSAVPFFKRKIPYHKWINIHKLMGSFYVLAVIHGLMVNSLIKELPITRVYVFGMSFIGIAAWFYRAFLFNLFNKKLKYTIKTVQNLGHGITEIIMKTKADKLEYSAGQFAFFNFPSISKKEQHPFTISSHPYDNELRIIIKGLGDYTNDINEKLSIGEQVLVEGPYGHFSSKYVKEQDQIWIAGGIGITPFLSLSKDLHPNKIKLFWCVYNEKEAVYKEELETISNDNPNFEFVIWSSKKSGHLTVENLNLNSYTDKAYLICGPKSLKDNMTNQLIQKNVSKKYIYDEEFAFR
ncbi:ferredoxin reductase family protein [Aquimarina macrocephali]|uniref:ferredoxin reductase family protein n=1 Tax=Aquimarina macrocephali TaxID=666563 RepID=UPI001378B881|nr:ferric reductase-like transmembrane domain-containing protein [Aquimarina macrocephali]